MNWEEIRKYLEELLTQQNIDKFFNTTISFLREDSQSYKEITILRSMHEKNEREMISGISSSGSYLIKCNQIFSSSLRILRGLENDLISDIPVFNLNQSFGKLINELKVLNSINTSRTIYRLKNFISEQSPMFDEIAKISERNIYYQNQLTKGVFPVSEWQTTYKETETAIDRLLSNVTIDDFKKEFLQPDKIGIEKSFGSVKEFDLGILIQKVSRNNIDGSFNYLREFQEQTTTELNKDFVMLEQRWNRMNKSLNLNTELHENLSVENSKIILSILNYAIELNEYFNNSATNTGYDVHAS